MRYFRGNSNRRGAFTLIELLVVIAIIAILAAILFPVFLTAKAQGKKADCMSRLKNIGLAFSLYIDNWSGTMPSGENRPQNNLIRRPLQQQLTPYIKTGKMHYGYINDQEKGNTLIPEVFFCPAFPEQWRQHPWYHGAGTFQCVLYDRITNEPELTGNQYPAKKLEYCVALWNSLIRIGRVETRVNPQRPGASGAQLMYCSFGGQFTGNFDGKYYYPHNNGSNCLFLDWHVKWNRDKSAITF